MVEEAAVRSRRTRVLVDMSICTRTGAPLKVVENDQVEIQLDFQIQTDR